MSIVAVLVGTVRAAGAAAAAVASVKVSVEGLIPAEGAAAVVEGLVVLVEGLVVLVEG